MTKAKMDYLWAPKSEGIVSDILDHIGEVASYFSTRVKKALYRVSLLVIHEPSSSN